MGFFKNLAKGVRRIFNVAVGNRIAFFNKPNKILQKFQPSFSGLTDEERFYAWFANEVYTRDRTSYKGFILLTQFNERTRASWFNQERNELVIAFRGTEEAKDIIPDLNIAFGSQASLQRFQDDVDYYKNVISFYPTAKVVATGHSLGGFSVANVINKVDRGIGFTYNGGVGVNNKSLYDNPRLNNVRTNLDPVSYLGREYMKTITPKISNIHSIINFL
jgi:hypothetical protein